MADARAQELPLLTVGDSEYVNSRLELIYLASSVFWRHRRKLLHVVRMIGWLGMIRVVVWLIWRGLNDVAPESTQKDNVAGTLN